MNPNTERNFLDNFYTFLNEHADCNLANPTHQEEPSIEIQTEILNEQLENVESKLDDVEDFTSDFEMRISALEINDYEERLDDIENWQERFTYDRDFKEQIKNVVSESLKTLAARGQIKIYISSEDES